MFLISTSSCKAYLILNITYIHLKSHVRTHIRFPGFNKPLETQAIESLREVRTYYSPEAFAVLYFHLTRKDKDFLVERIRVFRFDKEAVA